MIETQELFRAALRDHQQGRLDQAAGVYRAILQRDSRHGGALHLLGVIAHQSARQADALLLLRAAIAVMPDQPAPYSNLGLVLLALHRRRDAIASFTAALSLNPCFGDALANLGATLKEEGRLLEAALTQRASVCVRPDHAESHYNLGNALQELGQAERAVRCYDRALRCRPDFDVARMNLAFAQLYRPGAGLAAIHDSARTLLGPLNPARSSHRPATTSRLPRLGFLSADFRQHAVGVLALPTIEALAAAGYALTCYSNHPATDSVTERFITAADRWRPVAGLSDRDLAAQIAADDIDILFDLSGASAGNRLQVLATRPAPLQIGWLGYPATLGSAALDYILADRYQVPVGSERFYAEQVIRLPHSYVAFQPPSDSPPLAASRPDGPIVFGSFNRLKKLSSQTIAVWSAILARLPTSQLLLKADYLDCPLTRQFLAEQFAGHGIEPHRLRFAGNSTPSKHLAAMREADIALDPMPYSGGLTTLEALWMGLPVVTLPGESFASRHSLSYLSTIDLDALVARDEAHYVDLALALAQDPEWLHELRGGLRARLLGSPLCDISGFIAALTAALAEIWRPC